MFLYISQTYAFVSQLRKKESKKEDTDTVMVPMIFFVGIQSFVQFVIDVRNNYGQKTIYYSWYIVEYIFAIADFDRFMFVDW